MDSLWQYGVRKKPFPTLNKCIHTDVCIIGGGMAGVLCAHQLEKEGIDYCLLEADTIGSGITGCTTAKLTIQHGYLYDNLIHHFGLPYASLYAKANQEALQAMSELCQETDCDFEVKESFLYSTVSEQRLKKELAAYRQIGLSASFEKELLIPCPNACAVCLPNQGQFHPLKFLYYIANDLCIYEHTKALELIGTNIRTEHGIVMAKRVVVATHFPILNKHGSYFLKMYQHRSYVIALKDGPNVHGMYADESENGPSFRNFGRFLLLSGSGHRTGKKGGGYEELRQFAKLYYPSLMEAAHFATQDCKTLDGVPYIGQYAKTTPNLFIATGFNKWGMTTSMVAAKLLTDLLAGRESPYEAVFSPSRSMLTPQLFLNAGEAVKSFATPTVKRCPHLGCALHYNKEEHSYDCACHGSRFAEDGTLLDNPATGAAKHGFPKKE